MTTNMRVKLRPKGGISFDGLLEPLQTTGGMIWPYTPVINYQGNVNYSPMQPNHSNTDYFFYVNTNSIQLSISGKFTAMTDEEAQYMLASIHFLRSVTKMRFGASSQAGLPPPICELSGYGTGMFNNLNCIVNNFSVELPDSVDYIQVTLGDIDAYVPAMSTISVTVTVQNTPTRNRQFDFDRFASGAQLKEGGWL